MAQQLKPVRGQARLLRSWLVVGASLGASAGATATAQQPAHDPAQKPPAPAAPAPPRDETGPRGFLPIAEAESARASKAMREKILGLLRSFAQNHDNAPDKGIGFLVNIVQLGADAVPLLFEVFGEVDHGTFDAAYASAAARVLVGIFDRTNRAPILKGLADVVRTGGPAVKAGVLDGLELLDHAMVVEIAEPLVESGEPSLRAHAALVLGRQKSNAEAVGNLLRPLLQQQGAPLPELIQALRQLGDRPTLETVHGFLASKSEDPLLLLECVRYASDIGGRTSIPPLRSLLLRLPSTLPEPLLRQAINAVQAIGLRESDSKSGCQELLLETHKKLHDSRPPVADHARWQLGPFGNEEALTSLEDEIEKVITINKTLKQSNLSRYIELSTDRLHFLAWSRALDALKKAEAADTRKLQTSDIEGFRGVAYCGQDRLSQAENSLRDVHPATRLELLKRYPVLEKMAKDPKYRYLFPTEGK